MKLLVLLSLAVVGCYGAKLHTDPQPQQSHTTLYTPPRTSLRDNPTPTPTASSQERYNQPQDTNVQSISIQQDPFSQSSFSNHGKDTSSFAVPQGKYLTPVSAFPQPQEHQEFRQEQRSNVFTQPQQVTRQPASHTPLYASSPESSAPSQNTQRNDNGVNVQQIVGSFTQTDAQIDYRHSGQQTYRTPSQVIPQNFNSPVQQQINTPSQSDVIAPTPQFYSNPIQNIPQNINGNIAQQSQRPSAQVPHTSTQSIHHGNYFNSAPIGQNNENFVQPQSSVTQEGYNQPPAHQLNTETPTCPQGQVVHLDGTCVEPQVTRRLFVYAAPQETNQIAGPKPKLPPPEVHESIIFIRAPEDNASQEPIIIPPPHQQHTVYVLKKHQSQQQRVIKVPAPPPKRPEVYYIHYEDEEDNIQLPGGLDLQDALQAATGEAKGITDSAENRNELTDPRPIDAVNRRPVDTVARYGNLGQQVQKPTQPDSAEHYGITQSSLSDSGLNGETRTHHSATQTIQTTQITPNQQVSHQLVNGNVGNDRGGNSRRYGGNDLNGGSVNGLTQVGEYGLGYVDNGVSQGNGQSVNGDSTNGGNQGSEYGQSNGLNGVYNGQNGGLEYSAPDNIPNNGFSGNFETIVGGSNGDLSGSGYNGAIRNNGFDNGVQGHQDNGAYEVNGADIAVSSEVNGNNGRGYGHQGDRTNGHDVNGHESYPLSNGGNGDSRLNGIPDVATDNGFYSNNNGINGVHANGQSNNGLVNGIPSTNSGLESYPNGQSHVNEQGSYSTPNEVSSQTGSNGKTNGFSTVQRAIGQLIFTKDQRDSNEQVDNKGSYERNGQIGSNGQSQSNGQNEYTVDNKPNGFQQLIASNGNNGQTGYNGLIGEQTPGNGDLLVLTGSQIRVNGDNGYNGDSGATSTPPIITTPGRLYSAP